MINTAIFASGNGSNACKLLEHEHQLNNIRFSLIFTDNPNAGVIKVAQKFNKPIVVIEKKYYSKAEHERIILDYMKDFKITWILLAGYMRILSPHFIDFFHDTSLNQSRIINIHPSKLPKFKGKNAYEQAFNSLENESGITIHFVDKGVDTGKLLLQESFEKYEEDDLNSFKTRGLKVEHALYPKFLTILDNALGTNTLEEIL